MTARGRSARLAAVLLAGGLAACAHQAADVAPRPADPAAYAGWDCERLHDEIDRVQQRAAYTAYAVDAHAGNNMIALGLGVAVFWPALLAMRPDGPEADELAGLKGRFEALRQAAVRRDCPAPGPAMSAARAATVPVAAGDRLVYEDRVAGGRTRLLGLRIAALKRDRIDFGVDVDGRVVDGGWSQDLSGNTLPESTVPLLRWQRLLRPGLELGQVVAGELLAADDRLLRARVRGQVVAIGPQSFSGHAFDTAVIELYGDAPQGTQVESGATRLDGVMAVDRNSGLLLRLELRCANREFALRRRLLRVESQAH